MAQGPVKGSKKVRTHAASKSSKASGTLSISKYTKMKKAVGAEEKKMRRIRSKIENVIKAKAFKKHL